ncbi:hypothetical protein PGTUg99_012253 [Puccinia graminis f. sp. tritici]|uniref:Uncharacterized protein n=1 Tax=Puccinia graminis f. sp. tritici TaxID=56615 RepID=A0A5B0LKY9_PUCGR|nr:hypothetical protein PGTUg99_012253 [Puccinia graminis f. sp. tritici]
MFRQQALALILVTHFSFQAIQCAFPALDDKIKTLSEPLINDRRPSVVEILDDSTPLTLHERQAIRQHLAGNPQLQHEGSYEVRTSVEELPKSEGHKRNVMESRLADLKTLRDSLNILKRNPRVFFKYQNPTDYSSSRPWNQHHPLFKVVHKLDNIHESIEKTHPAVVDPQRIMEDPNSREIETIGIEYIEQLTKLLASIQANFIPEYEFNFLNLERLTCETIYYFYKHELITRPNLGILLTNEDASKLFIKHILQSYLYDQKKTRNWVPLNAKNILNHWLHFSWGNMFEGLPEVFKNIFSYNLNKAVFEAYQAYPQERKNERLKWMMDGIKNLVFSKIPTRPENLLNASGNSRTPIVTVHTTSLMELVKAFITIHKDPKSPSELSHLFQAIEYYSKANPNLFAIPQRTSSTFKRKRELMSKSGEILAEIENLQLYLSNKFNQSRWLNSIFVQPSNNFKSVSHLEEIRLLACYIKRIEEDYERRIGVMPQSNQFHQYCQVQLVTNSLNAVKAILKTIAESS